MKNKSVTFILKERKMKKLILSVLVGFSVAPGSLFAQSYVHLTDVTITKIQAYGARGGVAYVYFTPVYTDATCQLNGGRTSIDVEYATDPTPGKVLLSVGLASLAAGKIVDMNVGDVDCYVDSITIKR